MGGAGRKEQPNIEGLVSTVIRDNEPTHETTVRPLYFYI